MAVDSATVETPQSFQIADDLDWRKGSLTAWAKQLGLATIERKNESGGQQELREKAEQEWERDPKILGIWGFLFVLIIDCFVVNFLDRICNLSYWILVCLEDNDVIFGTIDFI